MILAGIVLLLAGVQPVTGVKSLLLLSTDPASGSVRIAHLDLKSGKASLLWQRRVLDPGTIVHVAQRLPRGRIALLAEKDRGTTYRTIRARDGIALGAPTPVAPDTSDLVVVGGVPALASTQGLGPVQTYFKMGDSLSPPSSDPSFTFAGTLTCGSVVYAYATSGSRDLSGGELFVYTAQKGDLRQIYHSDFAPGAFALVQSGDRLIAPLTDGQVRVYNVAEPSHPRFAGQFYRSESWIALATGTGAKAFYALKNDGTLQAYRWNDRKGIIASSNAVPGPPTDWARLFAYPGGVAIGKDDGTIHLYRASGSTLAKAGDLKLGTGPVFVLDWSTG